MRALICDDRTHLESLILIIQHDGDCHFVWWWLIRSGTCGNRRKSKPGPERAFFGSLRHLLSRLSYGGRNYSTCSQLGGNHFALMSGLSLKNSEESQKRVLLGHQPEATRVTHHHIADSATCLPKGSRTAWKQSSFQCDSSCA